MRPRLLDLFCGAGGAAMGYQRAGFDVVGVDIERQPHYPFEFHEADAIYPLLAMLTWPTGRPTNEMWAPGYFAAIHASPPCQAWTAYGRRPGHVGDYPKLVNRVRHLLDKIGRPYVIENVPGSDVQPTVQLCGSSFGLDVRRHRWFESNVAMPPWTPACDHSRPITGVYGHPHGKGGAWRNGSRPMLPSDVPTWSRAMGVDWMKASELAIAIPPAYTEWIGGHLLAAIEQVA